MNSGIQAFLLDNYLHSSQYLSATDTNSIAFNIDPTIPASSASGRFKIIFGSATVLPVRFMTVEAVQKDKDVEVTWSVAEENGIERYEVERSADGIHFTKTAEVAAKGLNSSESYSWKDENAVPGNNYYRIRAIEISGKSILSKIVVARIQDETIQIGVFPNPIINQEINISMNDMAKGQYSFMLVNNQGQQLIKKSIIHPGGAIHQTISLDKSVASGVYYLHVQTTNINHVKTIFVK
jgi:hypothetical protein